MQEESLNSWNQDLQKKVYTEQFVPRKLIKILDLLKNQRISDIYAKFSFNRESHMNKFLEALHHEEDAEAFELDQINKKNKNASPKRQTKSYYMPIDADEFQYKYEYGTNSPILAEIFLTAYKDTIKKLEIEHNVRIYKGGKNIIIATKVKSKNQMLNSEIMALRKRLKVYIMYRSPQIWKSVESSEIIQNQFRKLGIRCHFHIPKSQTIAFYSIDLDNEEQIKKIVHKRLGYTARIFNFYDNDLKYESNSVLFGLLAQAVEKKIKQIRQNYEITLQVNEKVCSFVLHLKDQVFGKQPIAQLQKFISQLTFVSFSIRNSRNYLNQIKRLAKSHPYLQVSQHHHRIYCCINHRKIKKKDEIMFIFKRFLENLQDKSRLTIHVKSHNTIQPNSSFPQRILDLIEQNKLTCKHYEDILNKKKHNIEVSLKNPNSLTNENKSHKQAQFANFLKNILDLEAQKFTQEEMNEIFLGYDKEEESLNQSTSTLLMKKSKNQDSSLEVNVIEQYHEDLYIGKYIEYEGSLPDLVSDKTEISKKEREKSLEQLIYKNETIKYRCWKLEAPKSLFPIQSQINLNKLFLVSQVLDKDGPIKQPQLLPFTMVEQNKQAYLIAYEQLMEKYVPVYLIKRMH